jgi:hypothetical protein
VTVEEIVADIERWATLPSPAGLRALIADWRKRGERIKELEPYESLGKALKILSDNGMGGRFS